MGGNSTESKIGRGLPVLSVQHLIQTVNNQITDDIGIGEQRGMKMT